VTGTYLHKFHSDTLYRMRLPHQATCIIPGPPSASRVLIDMQCCERISTAWGTWLAGAASQVPMDSLVLNLSTHRSQRISLASTSSSQDCPDLDLRSRENNSCSCQSFSPYFIKYNVITASSTPSILVLSLPNHLNRLVILHTSLQPSGPDTHTLPYKQSHSLANSPSP
jgi:hypothetical protein